MTADHLRVVGCTEPTATDFVCGSWLTIPGKSIRGKGGRKKQGYGLFIIGLFQGLVTHVGDHQGGCLQIEPNLLAEYSREFNRLFHLNVVSRGQSGRTAIGSGDHNLIGILLP